MPEISVIVPVYSAEAFLRKCTESILAQTMGELEVLLIDDGSPDGSGALCDQIAGEDSRVRVFHKENGGVSAARNMRPGSPDFSGQGLPPFCGRRSAPRLRLLPPAAGPRPAGSLSPARRRRPGPTLSEGAARVPGPWLSGPPEAESAKKSGCPPPCSGRAGGCARLSLFKRAGRPV